MSANDANPKLDEAPVKSDNQIVSSPGKNYFYEEYEFDITLAEIANVTNANTKKAFLVKQGRNVTMFLPELQITLGAQPNQGAVLIYNGTFQIPERFWPVGSKIENANDFNRVFLTAWGELQPGGQQPCQARWHLNNNSGINNVGAGSFRILASNGLVPTAGSCKLYGQCMSWVCQTSYNRDYRDDVVGP